MGKAASKCPEKSSIFHRQMCSYENVHLKLCKTFNGFDPDLISMNVVSIAIWIVVKYSYTAPVLKIVKKK